MSVMSGKKRSSSVKVPTESQLQALCNDWAKWLRLQDWAILVKIDNGMREVAGLDPHREHKSATIRMRLADCRGDDAMCLDPEVTLVHEMIHLYTIAFDYRMFFENSIPHAYSKDEFEKTQYLAYSAHEQMVECLAQALVGIKRGKPVIRIGK